MICPECKGWGYIKNADGKPAACPLGMMHRGVQVYRDKVYHVSRFRLYVFAARNWLRRLFVDSANMR